MRITIGVILVIALVIGILLVGFHIRHADVVNNNRHSADEIRADLIHDFTTGNSLYFSWKYKNPTEEERTPYLNSVQAKMISPGRVQIIVDEKKVIGGIVYGGSYVYFDETGLVLEISDTADAGAPVISGVSVEEPVLYQKLPVVNAALLRTMLNLSELIGRYGLVADEISFDENMNMTIKVGTIDVELGQDEYLEEKISNLVTLYPKISDQSGILKLSSYTGKSDDIQFEETLPETEAPEYSGTGEYEIFDEGYGAENGEDHQEEGSPAEGTDDQTGAEEQNGENGQSQDDQTQTGEVTGVAGFMVFDSSGTLRYDARVINGQVVDAYGYPIPGCSVNDDGNVVDAYWNVIDPMTGTLAGQ